MAITKELKDALEKMQEKDETAFATFYEQTYSYVYAKAKYIMHEEEDALDLTQETYIQAYRGISSIEDVNNVYAWLGGIVYRQGMRIFNKKKEVLTGEEQDYLFDEMESNEATPEQAVEQQATVNIVKGMIDELPELQRVAIMAFYYDNMKIDEIASMCECSANTIKSRLNYAKKFLKEKVEAHEKQNKYKLCSVSPSILLLAFKGLFAEPEYNMPAQAVESVYMASCNSLGIEAATSVAAGGSASAVGGTAMGGSASAAAGTAVAGGATVVKVGLGIKLAATVAALLAAGGITAAVVYNINNNSPKYAVGIPEKKTESEEQNSSELSAEESQSEELQSEDTTSGEIQSEDSQNEEYAYDDSVSMEGLYKCDGYTINITNATEIDNKNASFDLEIVNSYYGDEKIETLTVSQVTKQDGVAQINATSDIGIQWTGSLTFMDDGSIRMDMDWRDESGVWSSEGMDLDIFTKAEAEGLVKERVPQEGTYIFTEGTDVYKDGGYVLSISEVNVDVDTTFVMKYEIISDGGNSRDEFVLEMDSVFMNNGLGTFWGDTNLGVHQFGYLYVNEDGSISLSYTSSSGLENVVWDGDYPVVYEPIILKRSETTASSVWNNGNAEF